MFERLAPFLQEYIYSQGWEELKDIQVQSCSCIFDTSNNLLISSGTASGKTEAAFLPVLTKISAEELDGVSVLYISPLKALINDQFNRLEDLIKDSGINLIKWHGDVYSYKKDLNGTKNTILQITPESLESLITKKTDMAKNNFSNLKYIVIDEIHYFMSSMRGEQLRCLLSRLQTLTNNIPIRIGLSATIGNLEVAATWLSASTQRPCTIITDNSKKRMKLAVNFFEITEDTDPIENICYQHIFTESYNNRNIIFANSRKDVEEIAHNLTDFCLNTKCENRYHTHHASISKTAKEDLEYKMKTTNMPISTISTTTLELGIDIGALDKIIQVGCPYKVSSFLQRLGRTGRRTGLSQINFVIPHKKESNKTFIEDMNLDFLLTLAIIEIYKDEKWIEEPKLKIKPFSLLFHQTLAVLYSNGEMTQSNLINYLLNLPPFYYISANSYKRLLISMLNNDFIQLTEDKKVILGVNGETLINNFHFYSVFDTKPEYIVKTNTEIIGSTTQKQKVNSKFWLAGRCWRVLNVDEKNLSILVEYNQNEDGLNKWSSDGYFIVADELFKKVKELLFNDYTPLYIDDAGLKHLNLCREIIKNNFNKNSYCKLSDNNFIYIPWYGFENFNKLEYLLHLNNINYETIALNNLQFAIKIKNCSEEKFKKILNTSIVPATDNVLEFLKIDAKFNKFIPLELLQEEALFEYNLT